MKTVNKMVKNKVERKNQQTGFSNFYFLYSLLLIFFLASIFHILFNSSSSSHQQDIRISSSSSPPAPSSDHFVAERGFNPVGCGTYFFIQMGAYRGGLNTFAVVGLGSKPIHVYSNPDFRCRWIPHNHPNKHEQSTYSAKILPDWGYGRVYTTVVINCTFPTTVNADNSGGKLVLTATNTGGGARNIEEEFLALEELPGSVNMSMFTSSPTYEYLFCGSTLYGDVSPQWVREWMAHHVRMFGAERSHFVMHDAGGIHEGVMEVLRPWIENGVVSVEDVKEQERYDGYYHNQFMVVNDCFHRYRYKAKWIFFFDVDEFLYIDDVDHSEGEDDYKKKMDRLMESLSNYTQVEFEQLPMSGKLCASTDAGHTRRMWGIEKLVYRCLKLGVKGRNGKYAIQPRHAFAVGIHDSRNFKGNSLQKKKSKIKYFHFLDTTANRKEPCTEFVDSIEVFYGNFPYVQDERLKNLAASVKKFEVDMIGKRLMGTRQ